MLRVLCILAFAAAAPAAEAADYVCRALPDAKAASLGFTVRHSSGAYAVMRAELTLAGGRTYSTDAAGGARPVRVNTVDIGADEIAFGLGRSNAGDAGEIARVHLVTMAAGRSRVTAGVLSVTGAGVWAVGCTAR